MPEDVKPNENTDGEKGGTALLGFVLSSAIILVLLVSAFFNSSSSEMPYSRFLELLNSGQVSEVTVSAQQISGIYKDQKGQDQRFFVIKVDPPTADLLAQHKIPFRGTANHDWFGTLFNWVLTAVIFISLMSLMASRVGGGSPGTSMLTMEKSRARVYKEEGVSISFADVAGVDEAKTELQEVVNFLQDPDKYTQLGARLPKGILLVGPPGTGKTLLARAVAGEAKVAFLTISGSEFVELFVGVGAARVRDLFSEARKKSPCIIFIDELDALGKARGNGSWSGTHDEKEQTLNQLLVELDGFDPSKGVVLLAATNRPELLDPALLRAGRFDRQVLVDRPDRKGRAEILAVHLKKVRTAPSIDVEYLAASTPGLTGADLANLVNEAALLASRRAASAVEDQDFKEAIERQVAGLERKGRIISKHERDVVAHHEMGHALVSMLLPGTDPVQKVSIIPRGTAALGFTMQRPEQDRFLLSYSELQNRLTALLGGRAAELLVFGEASTGAADDLQKATELARAMVVRFGMSEKLGVVCYEDDAGNGVQPLTIHTYSDATCLLIDQSIRDLISEALSMARQILKANETVLTTGAQQLLEKETLTQEDLAKLVETCNQNADHIGGISNERNDCRRR
jgi:cell division protease FtsH